jgi:aspartate kinase
VIGGAVANEADAHRVQAVEGGEISLRIPPGVGDAGEALDLGGIDRRSVRDMRWLGHAALDPNGASGVYTPLSSRSMARIVLKFGGTSVGTTDRIKNVARKVKAEVDRGNEVAVVVSAMSGATDQLVRWVNEIAPLHDPREYDVVVATGEQVTIGLLALALQQLGVNARSWVAWQLPIKTDSAFAKARIQEIDTRQMAENMVAGEVPIVPGFQGVAPDGRITTLGRGGSDTSAVALAAALKADRCDIYTDVDGVYTTDPRIVETARKIDKVTYEEMLEMASQGSKVLQTRSVELAMNHHVRVQVLSSFDEALGSDLPGTLVLDEEEIMAQGLEKSVVSGIAFAKDEAKITVTRVPDRPGVAAAIFGPLADANINVDMIVQNVSARRQLDRHHLHRAARRPRARGRAAREGQGGAEVLRGQGRHQRRQDLGDRRRHAQPRRRRPQDVRDPGGQGDKHPGDLDLRDQGERAGRRRVHRARSAGLTHGLRAGLLVSPDRGPPGPLKIHERPGGPQSGEKA